MSVFSILTSIADKIRSLLGIRGKLGLDAMDANLQTANTEVATQEDLMNQIIVALEGKSASGGTAKEEQEKSVDIIENGTTEVLPDDGKVLSKVTVNVDVQSGGDIDALIDGSITEVSSNVENVRPYAFYKTEIVKANLPLATKIGTFTFNGCKKLREVNLPMVTVMERQAFQSTQIEKITFPRLIVLAEKSFEGNISLIEADFFSLESIQSNAFLYCHRLQFVMLRSETMCTLSNTNAFGSCLRLQGTANNAYNPNGEYKGYIFVPRALLSDDDETKDYRRATNWSTFSSWFRALEDYTVDGTITGELDKSKI